MARANPLVPPASRQLVIGDGRVVRLGEQVGRGRASAVHLGRFEGPYGLSRAVAVKLFDSIPSDEHERVFEALASAARRLATVQHPNVVRIEDFGPCGPRQAYAVTELVEGRSLGGFISHISQDGGRFQPDLALFIAGEIADGLAGAKLARSAEGVRLGIVHGELSPYDVLLSWNGEVKVSDFGFAAAAGAASSVRNMRDLARRMRSLAPEVARGQPGDARSDVFSLGVMLHEMLIGPRFPSSVSDSEALAWVRDGIVHQRLFEPHPSEAVQAILARALEKDPSRRYPHAAAMGYDLRKVAFAMGIGDGRAFLRMALARSFGETAASEHEESPPAQRPTVPTPRPSGVIDRFARLRGEVADETGERKVREQS